MDIGFGKNVFTKIILFLYKRVNRSFWILWELFYCFHWDLLKLKLIFNNALCSPTASTIMKEIKAGTQQTKNKKKKKINNVLSKYKMLLLNLNYILIWKGKCKKKNKK